MTLPQGTEPLILADGTVINPENGSVVIDEPLVEIPNTAQIKREIVASRMRISDLPVPPNQMNTLSVLLSYTLMGITDEDISTALLIPLEQVTTIKKSDEYTKLSDAIVANIVASDLSTVRGMFVDKSRNAANVMFGAMEDVELGINTRMTAAKDILDRAGQRPVDVVEHRHKMEGGLTIEYVEKKDDLPLIDVTPEF
jgi:hypothetical protein